MAGKVAHHNTRWTLRVVLGCVATGSQEPTMASVPAQASPQVTAPSSANPKKKSFGHHLVAGGIAGFVESSCW